MNYLQLKTLHFNKYQQNFSNFFENIKTPSSKTNKDNKCFHTSSMDYYSKFK